MEQSDKLKRELRAYCAFLLTEYELLYSPADPIIPALYAIHKDMQLNNRKNMDIAALISAASSKMKSQVFHFNSPGEAFKFQLGITLRWILIGALVFGFVWTASWVWSAKMELDKAKKIIEHSKVTDKLIPYVKTDADGFYFIEFVVTRQGNKEVMKVAKIDKNTIRVYLGKDSISAK